MNHHCTVVILIKKQPQLQSSFESKEGQNRKPMGAVSAFIQGELVQGTVFWKEPGFEYNGKLPLH